MILFEINRSPFEQLKSVAKGKKEKNTKNLTTKRIEKNCKNNEMEINVER
jgi:hypothetical protein